MIPVKDHYFDGNKNIESKLGPNTITRNIIQDQKGNMWFASWEGIVKFDGESFTNMTNKYELDRYRAFAIIEDRRGMIWIGTVGAGLFTFENNTFKQYTTEDGLASNTIGCIFEDKNGVIWIGTLDGVNKFENGQFTTYKTEEGGTNDDNNAITQDKNGVLWIGSRGKLSTFNGETFTEVKNEYDKNYYNVRSVITAKDGTIWFGGNDGLWSYDGRTYKQHSTNFVGNIFEDSKGNLFYSESKGDQTYQMTLQKYGFTKAPVKAISQQLIHNADGQVFGITEDSNGNIWFGLENGACRYDGHQFECFKD